MSFFSVTWYQKAVTWNVALFLEWLAQHLLSAPSIKRPRKKSKIFLSQVTFLGPWWKLLVYKIAVNLSVFIILKLYSLTKLVEIPILRIRTYFLTKFLPTAQIKTTLIFPGLILFLFHSYYRANFSFSVPTKLLLWKNSVLDTYLCFMKSYAIFTFRGVFRSLPNI